MAQNTALEKPSPASKATRTASTQTACTASEASKACASTQAGSAGAETTPKAMATQSARETPRKQRRKADLA